MYEVEHICTRNRVFEIRQMSTIDDWATLTYVVEVAIQTLVFDQEIVLNGDANWWHQQHQNNKQAHSLTHMHALTRHQRTAVTASVRLATARRSFGL